MKILAILILFISPAFAQQAYSPPDPVFLQRAISSIEAQRNQALTAQAIAEAKLAGAIEELTKTNARIKELEEKEKK